MSAAQQLEEQVKRLCAEDLREFRQWFLEWDSDEWDCQIESDAQAGKLDALAAEALTEYHAGKATHI